MSFLSQQSLSCNVWNQNSNKKIFKLHIKIKVGEIKSNERELVLSVKNNRTSKNEHELVVFLVETTIG